MSIFEFVSVILSVIFALCLSHLLIGVSALTKARGQIRSFVPHSIWLVATFLGAIQVWWSQWDFQALEWSFPAFFYVLLAPTLLFFAIGLLIPDRIGEEPIDLKDHFSGVRHFFLTAMLVFVVLTWLDGPLLAGQPLFGRLVGCISAGSEHYSSV